MVILHALFDLKADVAEGDFSRADQQCSSCALMRDYFSRYARVTGALYGPLKIRALPSRFARP